MKYTVFVTDSSEDKNNSEEITIGNTSYKTLHLMSVTEF